MGRKPNNEPMTQAEMIEAVEKKRTTSKLYKAEVKQLSDEGIQKSVQKAIGVVNANGTMGKVNLDDIDRVKSIVGMYLEGCAAESMIPSMADIAMCLGYTRQNLYHCMRNRRDTPTGKFLTQVHDVIANTLADNALKGNVNNIVAIFLLKSMYGFHEDDSLTTESDQEETFSSSQNYKEKYRTSIIGEND